MSAIKSIDTTLVRIPSGTPYQMGAMERGASHAISVIVRVETEGGKEGWGECFLTPGWYGADTPASMIWLIEASGATSSSTWLLRRASGGRWSVSVAKSLKVMRMAGSVS